MVSCKTSKKCSSCVIYVSSYLYTDCRSRHTLFRCTMYQTVPCTKLRAPQLYFQNPVGTGNQIGWVVYFIFQIQLVRIFAPPPHIIHGFIYLSKQQQLLAFISSWLFHRLCNYLKQHLQKKQNKKNNWQ